MQYRIIPKEDYNKELKFDGQKILCYTKKKLKELYPDDQEKEYEVIGEIKKRNKKEEIAKLIIKKDDEDCEYIVSEERSHNRFTFRRAGFVCVGKDQFIAILKRRWLIILLFKLLLIGAIILGWLLGDLLGPVIKPAPKPTPTPKPTTPIVEPLHPLPSTDPNEQPLEGEPSVKPGTTDQGGGTVTLTYTLKADLNLSTGKINMLFANPKKSTQEFVVELLLVNGNDRIKIAQSGRIRAGFGVTEMTFINNSAKLSPGIYKAEYRLQCYNPETGEKALVAPKIEGVVLTVT